MTLGKVIEILELNLKEAGRKMPPDTATALSVAIEAVKRLKAKRELGIHYDQTLLPGETRE